MSGSHAGAQLALATERVEAGDLAAAREIAEALVAQDAGDAGAHNVLGFIAYRERRLIDALRAFERACSLPGADDDMRANLEAVQAQLAEADAPDFAGRLEDLHAGALGNGLSPRLLGALLADDVAPELAARLDELPSAATAPERRLLFRFVARFWDGHTDVFENGPLLGGTTRALALGMLANPARSSDARLHTHDWFSSRVPLDLRPGTWEGLVERGALTQVQVDEMRSSGSFQAVYDHLHSGHDYSPLVHSHEAYLPGAADDAPKHGEAVFEPPYGRKFGIVFVDGAKSWYGTKLWMSRMWDRVDAGAHFIFQDYAWYTCFWLPALVGTFSDHFHLVAHVDNTHAFRLARTLDGATLHERFPDQPAEFGRERFDAVFERLLFDAGDRSDVQSMVSLTIQHAAALAYIGLVDEARERIAAMRDRPEFHAFRNGYIERALRSPTYWPNGTPLTL